jgi:hypothetical protein
MAEGDSVWFVYGVSAGTGGCRGNNYACFPTYNSILLFSEVKNKIGIEERRRGKEGEKQEQHYPS